MISFRSMTGILVLLGLVAIAAGYKAGPPVGDNPVICETMTPQHGDAVAKTTAPPYMVSADSMCYKDKGIITVSISNQSLEWYYEGFLMQVKKAGEPRRSYGKFMVPATYFSSAQTLDCFGNAASAVGHKNGIHFWEHSLKWIAPCGVKDDLEISVTMVKNEETFWLGVNKANLKLTYNENCAISVDAGECTSGAITMLPHAMAVIIMALCALNWAKL